MVESAYIHIPFCKQKCKYCTFISYPNLEFKKKYVSTLLKEIKKNYKGENLKTLYFGGGTPSLLEINDFKNIMDLFNFEKNAEITVEINPETIDEKYLDELYLLKVNRLSIGVQDFHDDILKSIGRIHDSKKAQDIIKTAQKAGFENISVDFIYGLPNQTKKMFIENLNTAFSLNVQHISLYGLKIENGCYFHTHPPKNLPNDDAQAEYYSTAIEVCKNNGFNQYEISNFAKSGFESKHNLNYWNNENYYGFGCAASGYENNIRYYNEKTLEKYIDNPFLKESRDILTPKQQLEEEIFLGFRKTEGINIQKINKKFNCNFEEMFDKVLKKYLGTHILKTDFGYKLSNKGTLLSNIILAEFLE